MNFWHSAPATALAVVQFVLNFWMSEGAPVVTLSVLHEAPGSSCSSKDWDRHHHVLSQSGTWCLTKLMHGGPAAVAECFILCYVSCCAGQGQAGASVPVSAAVAAARCVVQNGQCYYHDSLTHPEMHCISGHTLQSTSPRAWWVMC